MLLESINYDCISEIVKHLPIKYWNKFRLTSQYTKDITDFIDISKLNCTIDIDMGSRKINGKTIPIHYVGEFIIHKFLIHNFLKSRTFRHGLGIYTIPTAQKSRDIFKGEFSYDQLGNHVVVYKRCRKPKDTIVHHYYKKDDKQNRINYSGGWLNGKPHGNGSMLKKNKGQYVTERGNWIHGIKEGVFEKCFNSHNNKVSLICYFTYKKGIKMNIIIIYSRKTLVTFDPYTWTIDYNLTIKEKGKTIMEYSFQKQSSTCPCIFISFYDHNKKIIHPLEFDHSRCKCSFCNQLLRFKTNI